MSKKQDFCSVWCKIKSLFLFCRNYVFQKRYVKFDGKNLMYYGSEKVIVNNQTYDVCLCL